MKSLVTATLAAILGGLAVFFFQTWYAEYKNHNHARVSYDISNKPLSTSMDDLKTIESKLDKVYDTAKFSQITIKNVGDLALENQQVEVAQSVPGKGILYYKSESAPGDDDQDVMSDIKNDRLRLTYKLLNPREQHVFWVAYNGFGNLQLVIRRPGLVLIDASNNSQDDDYMSILPYVGLGAIALLVGFLGGASVMSAELKKKGVDVDSLLKTKATAPPSSP